MPDTTTTTSSTSSTTTTTTLRALCGNGVRDGTEQCDGTDVNGFCTTFGITGCFPAGAASECECCIPPGGAGSFTIGSFARCCNGGQCTPLGTHFCECPGTCGSSPYPTCGGSCTAGTVCVPLTDGGSLQLCGCTPVAPCETCGGGDCPAGAVCDFFACTCVAP